MLIFVLRNVKIFLFSTMQFCWV